LVDSCNNGSDLFVYADDAKLFRHITCNSAVDFIAKHLLDIPQWVEKWLVKLNIQKCKVVSYGQRLDFKNDYYLHSEVSISVLEHLAYIKDLGVTFDSKLKFDHHINKIVSKSYSLLGLIYRNFKYMTSDTFVMLYKTSVRSHLEYANCVRSPCRQMNIEK